MGMPHQTMHRRTLVTRPEEKENMSTKKFLPKEESYFKNLDLGLSLFRCKIKMRVDRCQDILKKIDHDSRLMRICFLQLMDLVDNCRKIVKDEQEQNIHLLQMLDGFYFEKTDLSSRTQTVSPMIAGIPIKRASILLKRLDPFKEIHCFNNARAPSPRQCKSQTVKRRTLSESIQPRHQEQLLNSGENQVAASSLDIPLPNCEVRCRRWPSPVSSTIWREFQLKQASIPLKRLDPRAYLIPEAGGDSPDDAESDAFGAVSAGHVPLRTKVQTNCTSCRSPPGPCFNSTPLVVLERLASQSGCSSVTDLNSSSSSLGSLLLNETELQQMGNYNDEERIPKCRVTINAFQHRQINQKVISNSVINRNKKKSQVKEKFAKRQTVAKNVYGDSLKRVQDSIEISSSAKKRRTNNTTGKSNTQNLVSREKRKISEKRVDEDPLEGPSWLYKDGMLKKTKLKRLKNFRKDYLIPFYYLPPTIYSSSEESEDEVISEKTSCKARKRRQLRRC